MIEEIERRIDDVLAQYSGQRQCLADIEFERLGDYFPTSFLQEAYVVIAEHIPKPDVSDIAHPVIQAFAAIPADGITYKDTYFVMRERAEDESLHLHELVHVIQWRALGAGGFIRRYIEELEAYGYRDSPLERMAYGHQWRFQNDTRGYDVFNSVLTSLKYDPS